MSDSGFPLPPPTFEFLVFSLKTQAEMQLGLMNFAYSYITRSGRIDDARLRAMSPAFMARYETSKQPRGSNP